MKPSASLLVCILSASTVLAEDSAIYDADPAHPWNRLSAALYSNAPLRFEKPDGSATGLRTGDIYDTTLNALDDFVAHNRENLIKDPVKRAVLQNELWATFDQVSDATGEHRSESNAIARRCATLIKRLALTDAEISALPDSYALTIDNKTYPIAYDPAQRKSTFLPADLLGDRRQWVILSGSSTEILQPAAIQHGRATQGRSVFYALVRLPAGRQATLAYLRQLANFPQPYVWNDIYRAYPYARSAVSVNPEVPQFPSGTQVALVRRMVLIDSNGDLVVSPIVESIQIRVFVIDPKAAKPGEPGNQDFYELSLAPDGLFKGNGGLRASLTTRNASHPVFERATIFSQGNNCHSCHGEVGVLSLNTYTHLFSALPKTPWFEPSDEERQNKNTLDWKRRDYSWGFLSALLQSNQ
jgi:hypothetical protein